MPQQMKGSLPVQELSESIHTDHSIVVTNRGPVEYQFGRDKKPKSRRGSGGMITALIAAADHMSMTWVAMAMTEAGLFGLPVLPQKLATQ